MKAKAHGLFFYLNIRATFCLVLVTTLVHMVFTQSLYTSLLDDTRNALMSFSSGTIPTSSPTVVKPTKAASISSAGWGWGEFIPL